MKWQTNFIFTPFFILVISLHISYSQSQGIDVIEYEVELIPDFENKIINGSVLIRFNVHSEIDSVSFDCGDLKISKVQGINDLDFRARNNQVFIPLSDGLQNEYSVKLFYSGNATKGIYFKEDELYTSFFTDHWMVCNMNPSDKAKFNLTIQLSDSLDVVANGELIQTIEEQERYNYVWKQDYESPAYTFGFVIGNFNKSKSNYNDVSLNYYSSKYSEEELSKIFRYTSDAFSFLEKVTGVPYPQKTYSQIVIGQNYQEMNGFAILKEAYGDMVLSSSSETNLITHELAHQWWGNSITCQDWSHLWLNEGFATFMSAVFNESRFGEDKYLSDITSYYKVYEEIKSRGGDKPLSQLKWPNLSRDDRNLVYFKGACFLHEMRKKMGETTFWNAIKNYSQEFYGSLVSSKDFQLSLESSSGLSLDDLFDKWVY